MGGRTVDHDELYRVPVVVSAQGGSDRYQVTAVASDHLVLEVVDDERAAVAEIGELVSIGCPNPLGWISGEARVIALRGDDELVITLPDLQLVQRRASHRVALSLKIEVAELDDDERTWVAGETVDVSADGFAAQLPPAQGVVVGDRLAVRLALPNGHLVVGEADAIAGGPLMRARWSVIAERDRDRIAGAINQAEVARRR
jgi:hypothetical protein